MTAESQELELARQQLRAQRRELSHLAERVSELTRAIEEERLALAAAERRADRYIDQLRALRESTSWRVTRPLRAVRGRRAPTGPDA
ncbi:MAG TPA: hypothetical protein VGC45_11565 [Gryllotalpicola sp.]